ncbi:conjugal transfer mating-pair stabilization protein TraG [Vibrio sp. OPT18]|uniref:conjugal transfer mating-pair stabilization protein TraG n=1 Tax=Vibrio sp. OPT18 TaxID=2778641 RepID=UPI00187F702E|nr:conjugal transfer mating-pair stabilization protein TraG [Vibrio sp. OPT18]MBE8574110.1 conjugal transfer mating pair stabilization protein TraG [Vibrio sp. OPT18]
MWEMYVFSGGDTAQKVFNAIALFFNSQERITLIGMLGILAVFITALRFIVTRDPNHIGHWFAVALLVPTLLTTPKTSMIILDSSQLGRTYMVDNIPIGVAMPAHYATLFMFGMSQTIDKFFRLPDSQAYSTSGMIFAARLTNLSQSIGVQDAELKNLWGQYLQNCIRKDITINRKYTWQQFATAGDIFTFLKNNRPSPLRRIAMNNDFVTCAEALPEIEKMFNKEAEDSWTLIGTQSQGARWAKEEALVQNALQNSMNDFMGINQSASATMKQNIAINGIRAGLWGNAASADAVGAAMNYANAQNTTTQSSTMLSMGTFAKEWLPIVHSVLTLLIVCTSIFAFLACFIPGLTMKVLKGYVFGYFYLAAWPVFFTFINMIMTYALQSASTDLVTATGNGISLSNSNQVAAMQTQYAAVAGWLMMLVPVISKYAISGGAGMAMGLAHQFTSLGSGTVSKNAGAAASGDLGFGNMQVDNQTLANMNANKHDMAYLDRSYGASVQRSDGTSVDKYAKNDVYNAKGGISQSAFDVNASDVQTRGLQQTVSEAERATAQSRTAYNNSLGTSSDALTSLMNSASTNKSHGTGTQDSQSANLNQTLSEMDSLVNEHAKANGLTKAESQKEMLDLYAGGEIFAEVSGGKSFLNDMVNVKGGLRGSAGIKGSSSDSTSEDKNTSTTDREAQSRQEQFNDLMGKVTQFSSNANSSELNSDTQQAAMNFNDSIRKSEDLAESVDLSHSQEQSYSAALQAAQNGSLGMNHDLKPEFQEYVERLRPNNVETIMNGYGGDVRDERDALFQGFLEEKFKDYNPQLVNASEASQINHEPTALQGKDLEGVYQSGSQGVRNIVEPELRGKLPEMADTYATEKVSHFNEVDYQSQRQGSEASREEIERKITNEFGPLPEKMDDVDSKGGSNPTVKQDNTTVYQNMVK